MVLVKGYIILSTLILHSKYISHIKITCNLNNYLSITIQAASKHQGPEIKMGPGQKSDPSKKKQGSGIASTDTPEDEVRGENTAAYMCVRHKV